jgi:hypothetical protein
VELGRQPRAGWTSRPRLENYNRTESDWPNPILADLDGDGKKGIIYTPYDGRLHGCWLDKTEHGAWPFKVTHAWQVGMECR